jgi:integrase
MDRAGATRALSKVARAAGISHPISPHGLRRTFCTTGLVAGISIRDMQYAMRHAHPRTTMRYDMAKANLDRHAAHAVAAYLAEHRLPSTAWPSGEHNRHYRTDGCTPSGCDALVHLPV